MSILFGATYPQRTTHLILIGAFAKRIWADDYPWAPTADERERLAETIEHEWPFVDLTDMAPSHVGDDRFWARVAAYLRRSASPGAAAALHRMNSQIDTRAVLPTIRVPTLVMTRHGDRDVNVEESRWLAEQIPGARFVDLPGDEHLIWAGDTESMLSEIEEFLTGTPPTSRDRPCAGNRAVHRRRQLDRAGRPARRPALARAAARSTTVRFAASSTEFRGEEVDTAGDGFFAAFDGPARAIRCAAAISGGRSRRSGTGDSCGPPHR